MASGFWQNGRFIHGATVRTAGTFSVGELELKVAAATDRARESGNALGELAGLLEQHSQLRLDAPDRDWNNETRDWEGDRHLLAPLAELYADQLLSRMLS